MLKRPRPPSFPTPFTEACTLFQPAPGNLSVCFKALWGTQNKDSGQGEDGECQGGRVPELGQTRHQRDRAQQEQRAVAQGTRWGCCQAAQVPKTASRRVGCSAVLPGEGVCRYRAHCTKGASPALQRLVSRYRSAFDTPPPSYLTFSTKLFSLFHLSSVVPSQEKIKKIRTIFISFLESLRLIRHSGLGTGGFNKGGSFTKKPAYFSVNSSLKKELGA